MRARFQAIKKRSSLPLPRWGGWLSLLWFIGLLTKIIRNINQVGAIPMATDIAFALGIVALLSKQVPPALKVFLLALAIIDDLGAIIVIALFFSHEMSMQALTIASIAIVILVAMNRYKVTGLINYAIIGTILWASVLKSGVHATLAGVIIGFCIPLRGKKRRSAVTSFGTCACPRGVRLAILPVIRFLECRRIAGRYELG
ncbi:pH-dependent sodium/proton antiporter [Actinobacillus pleuropneumoniae]|nr:pH-dependent sodium/proton antiporter [Actinobacillus pleuropneumoniae]